MNEHLENNVEEPQAYPESLAPTSSESRPAPVSGSSHHAATVAKAGFSAAGCSSSRDFEAEIYGNFRCPPSANITRWCRCATCLPKVRQAEAWDRHHAALEPTGKGVDDHDPGKREWGIAKSRLGD